MDSRKALDRILAEQREREGPPVDFDHRGCRAVLCWLAAAMIAVFFTVAWAIGWSPWEYAKGVM